MLYSNLVQCHLLCCHSTKSCSLCRASTGRVIISHNCIYSGSSKLKIIKHLVTTVYSYRKKIDNLFKADNRIYLYQYICKNYVRRKDITIVVQKGPLTHGRRQLVLSFLLMFHDFEHELLMASCCVRM